MEAPIVTPGDKGVLPGTNIDPIAGNIVNQRYASFSRRYVAYFLDGILLLTFTFVVLVIAFDRPQTSLFSANNLRSTVWLIYALHLSANLGYFTILIGNGGVTVGKWIMGIKVINTDGTPISYGKAFLRAIAYMISAFFLYIGFLIMLIDSRSQTFHDKIAGTYVVEID